MKDYSNHYPSSKQRFYENGKSLFLKQLNGFEGFDVLIDGIQYKVIIQQHTSPMNEEKEDRLLLCLDNVIVNRGSVVRHDNKDWLVRTDVDFNGIYKSCKIQKTNNTLTFKNTQGSIISLPCIISNLTLYSDGLYTDRVMTMMDGKRNVIVPYTEDSKEIFMQQRFIFNHNSVFSVSLIDDFTVEGLLQLTMIQDVFREGLDDRANNLAYNEKTDNTTTPLTTLVNPIGIIGNDTIRKTTTETYTVTNITDFSGYSVYIDYHGMSNTSATLEVTNDTIKIKGLVSSGVITLIVSGNGVNYNKDIELKGLFG